jgi:N-sulfoglucosamine sulfohydrolase
MISARVTIAVCQLSRQSMMTGLYLHTLTQILRENGYYTGIIGKVEHLHSASKFCGDFCDDVFNAQNNHGRSPYIYHRDSLQFFEQAKKRQAVLLLQTRWQVYSLP